MILCLALGCADEHEAVHVEGNVVAVTGAPGTARRTAPEAARPLTAFRTWFENFSAASAIAQSSCGAAVEGVLACLATQGAGPTFGGTCGRVRSNCEFEVEIELAAPGDSLFLFFCVDADGNGSCEPTERSAPHLNFDKVGNFCNGDVIRVTNVSIDFASQTCSGPPASVVADGCAPPDPTSVPAPTATRGPGEPPPPPPGGPSPTLPPGVPTFTPAPPATASPVPTATRTPQQPPQCRPSGSNCTATSQCCASNLCVDGVCEPCVQEGVSCAADPPLPCCNPANSCQAGVCSPCAQSGEECDGTPCCPSEQTFCDPDFQCTPCLTLGESGCSTTDCCPGQGVCFDDICQFCSLTGASCDVSEDCCAFGAGEDCNGGVCAPCAQFNDPCNATSDCCEGQFLVCDGTCVPTV